MKLVYCSANIYLLVYISHFFPIISRRHLKHTADKCTRAWEFKKPFIFCFITLRYIQAKINEQFVSWFVVDVNMSKMLLRLLSYFFGCDLIRACKFKFLLKNDCFDLFAARVSWNYDRKSNFHQRDPSRIFL